MINLVNSKRSIPLSKEEFAYESIKEAILSGELLPNQQISLSALANDLGTSIIPINNAIRRLITEGLVRQDPHHSPYVEEFSAESVKEILTIRYHLEELALREAILFIGEAEMKELYALKSEMDQEAQNHNTHAYGIANRNFHMKIYSYNPYRILYELINDLWNKAELNRSRSVFSLVPNMMEHSQVDHAALLDFIKEKRTEDAIKLLREHRRFSREKLLGTLG